MIKYNHRYIEIMGILVFLLYCGFFSYQILLETNRLYTEWNFLIFAFLFVSLLFGYLGADFFSGLVHFLGDTFGTENTPILGQSFIKPFREHHVDPKGMTKHDFVETSGNNCIVSLPFMMLIYHTIEISTQLSNYFLFTGFIFLMISVFITNQIHKWAHLDHPGKIILFLQKSNLILSPNHHQVHHTAPYNKYYCITVGWLNPILSKIHFFEIIRTVAEKLFGKWITINK
ncbi:MAG: fatty acid desaturase CarF family protein [Leptospira sp.]|nr:fatty acid desaturase CarF family protein [Leptospira sp.]